MPEGPTRASILSKEALSTLSAVPQGLKPAFYAALAARLKPCPFKPMSFSAACKAHVDFVAHAARDPEGALAVPFQNIDLFRGFLANKESRPSLFLL